MLEKPIREFSQEMAALEPWVTLFPNEICGFLFVSNEPVCPDVGYGNLNLVRTSLDRIADIDAPRRRPSTPILFPFTVTVAR